jgi:hypothetical protein
VKTCVDVEADVGSWLAVLARAAVGLLSGSFSMIKGMETVSCVGSDGIAVVDAG